MKLNTTTARVIQSVTAFIKPPAPPRVLVVDDEEGVRRFVARVLSNAGYEVQVASGGTEALEAADRGNVFDLVVTDVRMPSMSGPRFVAQLRQQGIESKILFLTGYNEQLFDERGTLWMDEAYLDKPCSVNGLLESVALLLTGHLGPAEPRH